MALVQKGLVIREPYVSLLMSGEKIWEMRKQNTKIRGLVGLIRKGSGHVVGVAELVECRGPLNAGNYAEFFDKHRVPKEEQAQAVADGWVTPWVLKGARRLPKPVPYQHKSGAVIWVTLDPDVAEAVSRQA